VTLLNKQYIFLGWGYDEVLHYFKKSEDNEDPEVYKKNSKFHGKGGYLTVEWFPYVDHTAVSLIKVLKLQIIVIRWKLGNFSTLQYVSSVNCHRASYFNVLNLN